MRDSQVRLANGRELAYTDIGERGRPCLVFFHGAPMSRLHLPHLDQQFLAAGMRVVSVDRPDYGRSTSQPGRSMADWPADVAALTDALDLERFMVAGHSSGGPYALACAALLPDRLLAASVLGGVTDMGWPDAWEGYIDSEIQLMRLADEEAAITWCQSRFGVDGSGFLAASDFELAEPDTALLADERIGPAVRSTIAEAFRQGVAGYARDILIQGRPWPFDPARIVAPVDVVHGEVDAVKAHQPRRVGRDQAGAGHIVGLLTAIDGMLRRRGRNAIAHESRDLRPASPWDPERGETHDGK